MLKLEDISSVRIKGGIFEEKTDLPLFKKNKQIPRFSLLYGKNGSGKSTISRAFRKLAGVEEKQIDSVEILNTQDIVIPIIDELKEVTYVFNEDFIEDNIRIDGDGLNTIVVMGAVKDIDDKIKNIQPNYDKCVEDVLKQQEKYDEYVDPKNKLCEDFYIEEMQKVLRGDDSWASRDALIVGRKTNSQVKRDTYTKFIGLTPSKKRDELIVEFNAVMKRLEAAKTGSKKIDKSVPELKEFNDKEAVILCLLAEKIEKPVLTEREKMLFLTLQEDNGSQRLSKIKAFFATKRKTTCPVCFQDVEKEYDLYPLC